MEKGGGGGGLPGNIVHFIATLQKASKYRSGLPEDG